MARIIGREEELKILETIYHSNKAEFLAIYGRRRIGKTFLISEHFKDKGLYFEITGIKKASLSEQLRNFAVEMSEVFYQGKQLKTPKSWQEAFTIFRREINKITTSKKIILFFDELPWLASPRSNFLNALDYLWNCYLSRNSKVILIVCGSAASWVIKKIINSRGGFYGRVTRTIRLLPFNLAETERYLKSKNIQLDRKQIIDIYMALGGVPKYLSYLEKGKSATQNINDLCFSSQGQLYREFNKLYNSLFDGAERHIAIIRALAKRPFGLMQDELAKTVRLKTGGTFSDIIQELIESGFIAYIPAFSKKEKLGHYKLIDEYSLFYIIWVESASKSILNQVDKNYWIKQQNARVWSIWSGFAFESLCLKHIDNIKRALGISGVSTVESGWRYKAISEDEEGAQIDLVISRADNCVNLCEIKYLNKEFSINKQYAKELVRKKQIFIKQTETKKTPFVTLITTYGVKENANYLGVVDNQLLMDDFYET